MSSPLDNLKMLVVDDDDVDRERVRRILQKSAQVAHVVEAESGWQALQILQADAFDCIVLDNHLGDTTGAELISRIQQESRHGCPIIMVTGAGSETLAVQAMMDGAYDYLPKTQLSPDVLLRSVKRAVELYRTRRELAQIHESLEQRVDEQAATIRQSAKDLRALVDNAPTAMGYWDRGQHCRFGNLCLSEWFHVHFAQLPGMHLRDLLGAALYDEVQAHVAQALQGREQAFEQALPTDGSDGPRWLYWQLRPDVSVEGGCLGFYATLSDITASRQVQARVEELLHFSDAVIDHSPIGIAVFQSDGVCALSNQSFVDTCGERPDWKGTPLWSAIQSTWIDGGPTRVDVPLIRTGLETIRLACSMVRFDRSGQHHVLVIARDVTEQRRAHEALVLARDSAESAARAKSAFLANMSHEIRTPMNAIVGFSRLTLEDELPDTARTYIEKIHTSALALMHILDDVLDYSKIEAGFMHLEHTRFVLEETLQRVADLFQARIEQKRLSFIVEVAPNVPRVLYGDPLRLSQVLTNLVGNAIKFTEQGYIHLKVALTSQPADKQDSLMRLAFSVVDTGLGVAPDVQPRLFEAFIQGDSSITRRFGGTGLGLAICKRLVNLMGGHVGVRSELGKGSEFWFNIAVSAADEALAIDPSVDLAGRRVLILDGNPLWRKAMVRQLRAWHVAAHACADVAAALAHVERLQRKGLAVDTLLVDYPTVCAAGKASLDQLRERVAAVLGERPMLIYVTTPSEHLDTRSEETVVGHVPVLLKPVLASRLLEVLHGQATDRSVEVGERQSVAQWPNDARMQSERLRDMAAPLSGARILLVEDNELNQTVADELLRRCGMQVMIVDNGVKAIEAVQAAGPEGLDAVLMDMHMPVMDGLEATRRIVAMAGFSHLPIIGMTAAVLQEDRMRCAEAGMVDHIAKPLMPEQVIGVLLRRVSRAGDGDQAATLSVNTHAPVRRTGGVTSIDLQALMARVHGNEALARRLLSVFHEQEQHAAAWIAQALARDEQDAARRKAHDLKGSSANLGLMAYSQACAALQEALTQGQHIEATYRVFERAHRQCMRALQRFLARGVSD